MPDPTTNNNSIHVPSTPKTPQNAPKSNNKYLLKNPEMNFDCLKTALHRSCKDWEHKKSPHNNEW